MHDARHTYGNHETPLRVIPSPDEILGMKGCADWLRFVAPEDARIAWLRADFALSVTSYAGSRSASKQAAFSRRLGGVVWRQCKTQSTH
jgi:hypothetical protein